MYTDNRGIYIKLGTFEAALKVAQYLENKLDGIYELESVEKYGATYRFISDYYYSKYDKNFRLKIKFGNWNNDDGENTDLVVFAFDGCWDFDPFDPDDFELFILCAKVKYFTENERIVNVMDRLKTDFPELCEDIEKVKEL